MTVIYNTALSFTSYQHIKNLSSILNFKVPTECLELNIPQTPQSTYRISQQEATLPNLLLFLPGPIHPAHPGTSLLFIILFPHSPHLICH